MSNVHASQFVYDDVTVMVSRCYRYTITAWNLLGGESGYSNTQVVTPAIAPSRLDAPTEVTHDTSSVTLQWVEPSYDGGLLVTAYKLFFKAEYETVYTEVFTGLTLSHRVSNLRAGFNYQFKI